MRDVLITSIFVLLAAGCSPTMAQLADMSSWSAAARKSCTHVGQCLEPAACCAAVVVATAPKAGRAEYNAAVTACWPYRGTQ